MFAVERWIAGRYLRPKRAEGFLSIVALFSLVGVALGVGTLIVVLAVMDGFRIELSKRIVDLNGDLSIYQQRGGWLDNHGALGEQLKTINGVSSARAVFEGQTLVTAGERAAGGFVKGFHVQDLLSKTAIKDNIVDGKLEAFGPGKIVIGKRMADKLTVSAGDKVTLIVSDPSDVENPEPKIQTYTVAALFDVGLYEFDIAVIYLPLVEAHSFFGTRDVAAYLEVTVDRGANSNRVRSNIDALAKDQYVIHDWQAQNKGLMRLVETQRNVMFLVLSLIVLVAALNIISAQVMLANSKSRDIAMLRAMGATKSVVMRAFLFVGGFIGAVGTFIGLALGLLFVLNIERLRKLIERAFDVTLFDPEVRSLSEIPVRIETSSLIAVVLMAIGLSLAAAFYPSWKAARRAPALGLRS